MNSWRRAIFSALLGSVLIHAILVDLWRGGGRQAGAPRPVLNAQLRAGGAPVLPVSPANPDNSDAPPEDASRAVVSAQVSVPSGLPGVARPTRRVTAGQASVGHVERTMERQLVAGTSSDESSRRPMTLHEGRMAYRLALASAVRAGELAALSVPAAWRCVLSVAVEENGSPSAVTLEQSSGDAAVDRLLTGVVARAARRTRPPTSLQGVAFSVEMEIVGTPAEPGP